jgi:hypothetical protein
MATTTNYGWTTPNDTDLVKDGAAAIRTLGSSVDTTTKALNPSTTLGDIEYRSATANTNTRLGIGSTGNVLTVTGGVPTWAAPAGNKTIAQIATGTLSGTSVSLTGLTQDFIVMQIISPNWGTGADAMDFNINSNTTGVYDSNVLAQDAGVSNTRNSVVNDTKADFTFYSVDRTASSIHYIFLSNCATSGFTTWESHSGFVRNGSGNAQAQASGIIKLAASVTSIQLSTVAGYSFSGGTYTIWGG